MVQYSSGYLLFVSYLTMIVSCINKRELIEITSLQERKNSPLEDMSLLAMNYSLYEEIRAMTGTCGPKHKHLMLC